jgi:hypothetical protein
MNSNRKTRNPAALNYCSFEGFYAISAVSQAPTAGRKKIDPDPHAQPDPPLFLS